jgi:hypothetical protein
MFGTRQIKQGRLAQPTGSTWGSPTLNYLRTFEATVQPFTGDDHIIMDKFSQHVRDYISIYDITFDIKFDDVLVYNNEAVKVVYVLPFLDGVIPHIEVYTAEYAAEVPEWP